MTTFQILAVLTLISASLLIGIVVSYMDTCNRKLSTFNKVVIYTLDTICVIGSISMLVYIFTELF